MDADCKGESAIRGDRDAKDAAGDWTRCAEEGPPGAHPGEVTDGGPLWAGGTFSAGRCGGTARLPGRTPSALGGGGKASGPVDSRRARSLLLRVSNGDK